MNARQARETFRPSENQQKRILLKNTSDQIDLLWKCPAEIARFVYALEQTCLHKSAASQSPEEQEQLGERLQLIWKVEDALLAEERLVHMRNGPRLTQMAEIGAL